MFNFTIKTKLLRIAICPPPQKKLKHKRSITPVKFEDSSLRWYMVSTFERT